VRIRSAARLKRRRARTGVVTARLQITSDPLRMSHFAARRTGRTVRAAVGVEVWHFTTHIYMVREEL